MNIKSNRTLSGRDSGRKRRKQMNKQEAIEEIKKQSTQAYDDFAIMRDTAIHIVNQINEPQKVTVPKFVADLYESIKDDFENKLYDLCLQFNRDNGELSIEVLGWFDWVGNEPIQTLVKMKLYGYEVEQEKLYTVEIPNPNLNAHVVLQKTGSGLVLVTVGNAGWAEWESSKLTEAEIKKDFEWAWDAGFAKEV